jgi:hypothetical protein
MARGRRAPTLRSLQHRSGLANNLALPGMTGRLIGLAIGRYAGTKFFERTEADGNEDRQAHGTDRSIGVCARRCDSQRRIWLLQRPRDDCDILKSVKLPLEGEALLRPTAREDFEHFGEALAALAVRYAIGLVGVGKAAAAHAENKASMAEVIKRCDLLGQAQWVTQRQHLHRNADFHAAGLRSDGASDQQGSRGDRSLREEVQFRDPDDVETPALSRVHLSEGLRECLRIRHPFVARKFVKDTELE